MEVVVYSGNLSVFSSKHKSKKKYFGVLFQSSQLKFYKDEKKVYISIIINNK